MEEERDRPAAAEQAGAIADGVRVFDVRADGPVVHVAVYGGQDNLCGTVRFTFHDAAERADHLRRLQAWSEREVPLFLVAGDGVASLSAPAADQG